VGSYCQCVDSALNSGFPKEKRIHHFLAVEAHGDRLAQADIPERTLTIPIQVPTGEGTAVDNRFNGLDVEVQVLLGGTGGNKCQ